MIPLDTTAQKVYDMPTSAKSDDEIGVSYSESGINTHSIRKGMCFYARSLPTHCACLMVDCAGEQQCSPFLSGGTPILCNPSPFRLASFGDGKSTITERDQTMKALSFNGVILTPVHHNHQIYLTSAELAKALGYARADYISTIYNRNADEFSDDMTTTVNLSVVRKTGKVEMENRIFSLRGCHLIAMFSRTPVAKDFRKWVLDILDKEVGAPTITPIAPQPTQKISKTQYNIIRRAIYLISNQMAYPKSARRVISERLRSMCQTRSLADIDTDDLYIVQNELYRIERILSAYINYRMDTELHLLRRICRDDSDAIWQAMREMDETRGEYCVNFDETTSFLSHATSLAMIEVGGEDA